MSDEKRWTDHPILIGTVVAVITAVVTGVSSSWVTSIRMEEMVKNNTALINRLYSDYKDDLEGERRTTDAYINGILPRIENLERRLPPSALWERDEQRELFRYALLTISEVSPALVPSVPPPTVIGKPRLFDRTIAKLEMALEDALNTKPFSEMSEEEKDNVRTITVKLNLARAWRVWCSQNEANAQYCKDRFGEP